MALNHAIDQAANKINGLEKRKQKLARLLAPLKERSLSLDEDWLEEKVFLPVGQEEFTGKVAGVDSGFMVRSFSGVDIILIRAMASVFELKEGRLEKAYFHPNFFKFPEPFILSGALERDEFNCAKSLHRLKEEVGLSAEVIEKFKPDFLFIDGSMVPQHADKPRNASQMTNLYHEVLNDFQNLYQTAEKEGCQLIASVEDSRGTRFKGLVQKKMEKEIPGLQELDGFSDSVLLDLLLKKGERSLTFSYASKAEKHPILNDLDKKWSERIRALYLKPTEYDRPLRIEFIANGERLSKQADKVAAVTHALSCLHKEYAYPSVLIEADLRARLKPEEINLVFDKLADKVGRNAFVQQRRDKRPF